MILQKVKMVTNATSHGACIEKSLLNSRFFTQISSTAPIISNGTSCHGSYRRYNHRNISYSFHDKLQLGWCRTRRLMSSVRSMDHEKLDCYSSLLKGLETNTVPAEDDGHPLAVYTIAKDSRGSETNQQRRTPVLLLHGRTWSSVPVYHLVGGRQETRADGYEVEAGESRSLIEALFNTDSIQPYAMDFRGFGGTPKDETGFVEPLRCVKDAISVLNWIQSNEVGEETNCDALTSRPALMGWSHGALIAQIAAQRHPSAMSKLILYGSIYTPNVKYSIPPPPFPSDSYKNLTDHDDFPVHEMASQNEYGNATEDFTHNHVVSNWFAESALICDPIKVQWWNLHQLNECHPSLVKIPTMVIAGDQDPYAPMLTQAELFTHLGKGEDRVWSIIANADHAVHLSDKRYKLVENVRNFLCTHN